MNCSNVIFKGEDAVLRFYIEDEYSNLEIKVYTDGKTMVTPSEITTEDGLVTMYFHNDDLDILNDGVLRYDVQYDVDGETVVRSICSDRYLKTPDGYSAMTADEVYDEGYRDGFRDGLSGDCSSAITEAFQSGYTDGHLAGMVEQAIADTNRLTHLSATTNGTYTAPYGYSEVIVDVPASSGSSSGDCSEAIAEAYESGWTGGIFEQKGKLVSSAFTGNGTYTREDGWSSVTIDVPMVFSFQIFFGRHQSVQLGTSGDVSNIKIAGANFSPTEIYTNSSSPTSLVAYGYMNNTTNRFESIMFDIPTSLYNSWSSGWSVTSLSLNGRKGYYSYIVYEGGIKFTPYTSFAVVNGDVTTIYVVLYNYSN